MKNQILEAAEQMRQEGAKKMKELEKRGRSRNSAYIVTTKDHAFQRTRELFDARGKRLRQVSNLEC